MPAVAASDEELARFVEYLAGRAENPRTFTPSQPSLDMALPGGARLAAARDTARVSVTIRRHRVRKVTLADLVEWGSLTPVLANFFSAAVKAKLSIVIAAGMGVGKTTFLRALCAEMDASEIMGTFESDYELYLHELHDQHWVCHAWEVRTGSGEVSFNGRPAGSRSTMEQIIASYRHRLDRQIVGEVRGEEVWDMVKAMESGAGSLSTTHAVSATKAIDKLISCAMEAGPQISPEVAARKLAQTVDLVVQLGAEVVREGPGGEVARKRRYVEEVVEVVPGEKGVGYATNVIFRRQPGQCAVANMPPDGLMDSLIAHGLNQSAFKSEMAQSLRPERFS
jgi:Flp pilus assembly CpaF family ATPase